MKNFRTKHDVTIIVEVLFGATSLRPVDAQSLIMMVTSI